MKTSVRKNFLEKLNSLSPAEKKRQSEAIEKNIEILAKGKSGVWLAFQNLRNEPEVRWDKISNQINWAFPKVKNEQLEFYQDVGNFHRSDLGFSEPLDGFKVDLNQVEACLIPGLAFDQKGYRLGRGKGFYDRSLSDFKGKKIGICFNLSLCEELPHEEHDIRCDQIVTENKIFNVKQEC